MIPETAKLLGSTNGKMAKKGENLSKLEITEVIPVHCNPIKNDYQHDARVLYTFVLINQFGQFLEISLSKSIFLKTFNSEVSYVEIWFTCQSSQPLETEGKVNLTLVIN